MDEETKRTGLNYSLLATPTENFLADLAKMDRERYGEIAGVMTEYYTNSFHVPISIWWPTAFET